MNDFESKSILHQVYYERYKNKVQNEIVKTINEACNKVKEELRKTDGVYTKQRYKEIIQSLKGISTELSEDIENEIDIEKVIESELESQRKLLENYAGIIDLTLPTVEQLMSSVQFKPFVSKTFEGFLKEIDSRFYDMWDSEVRSGYLTGETTSKIIRRIMGKAAGSGKLSDPGLITPFSNSIINNTRTALQSFANETRTKIYEKNDSLFSGYKWVSTLDRRTCLICGQLDGKVYKSLDKVPDIPVHMNCRCLTIPVVKGMDIDLETERVSEGGTVSGKITYKEWFENQSDKVKREILGQARYKLYSEGKAEITTFINDNKILTLDEVKERI